MTEEIKTAAVEEALEAVRAGRMIIIVDDEDRENEGDLMVAAEKTTPEIVNFMARYGRGLICLPLTDERLDELHLPLMVSENTARFQTAFTVSIDAKAGVTTGISAADRARTMLAAVDPATKPDDLARPGHVFPLQAQRGRRPGAGRPDRGRRRPGPHGRTRAGRRHLRGHERGRLDGPDAAARARSAGASTSPS